MTTALADTIVAIATAAVPGQGSVCIVRLSGSQSRDILEQVFRPAKPGGWHSHGMRYGWMRDPQGVEVDEGLAVWMQAPRSYTSEDVVELHCHGGVIPVQQVLHSCLVAGARLANPGEFTLRAFLGGRIDLTQAESVADLVQARSPWAAQVALAGIQGKILKGMQDLRQVGMDLLAELEARLDFEDDLPPLNQSQWQEQFARLQEQVGAWLATAQRGSLLRQGVRVAIVGQPNVGKSSLLNLWSGHDRAIVTDLPGTTRDVVESHLVVKGIPVMILDTAGIRATQDPVEVLGVKRAEALAQEADLVLLVVDASRGWTTADQDIYERIQQRAHVVVVNKCDLRDPDPSQFPQAPTVALSTLTGQGLQDLEQVIYDLVSQGTTAGDPQMAINERQAALLVQVQTGLAEVQAAMEQQLPYDFWTIGLREAVQQLGAITGEEVTESVLERIFSRFCIGK